MTTTLITFLALAAPAAAQNAPEPTVAERQAAEEAARAAAEAATTEASTEPECDEADGLSDCEAEDARVIAKAHTDNHENRFHSFNEWKRLANGVTERRNQLTVEGNPDSWDAVCSDAVDLLPIPASPGYSSQVQDAFAGLIADCGLHVEIVALTDWEPPAIVLEQVPAGARLTVGDQSVLIEHGNDGEDGEDGARFSASAGAGVTMVGMRYMAPGLVAEGHWLFPGQETWFARAAGSFGWVANSPDAPRAWSGSLQGGAYLTDSVTLSLGAGNADTLVTSWHSLRKNWGGSAMITWDPVEHLRLSGAIIAGPWQNLQGPEGMAATTVFGLSGSY